MPQANKTGKKVGGRDANASRHSAPGDKGEVEIPEVQRAEVQVRADTLNEEDRTVEIVWAAGADVKRYDWWEGEHYIESLSMDPAHIRLDRFRTGMSLLDGHQAYSMDNRIGTVIPESVRIENGLGVATVRISRKQQGEELMQDLRDGHPFPVSVGYKTHAYEKTEASDTSLARLTAIDWEPMELSAVPIPADPAAHSRGDPATPTRIRVAVSRRNHDVDETRAGAPKMPQPNQTGRKPGEANNPNGQRAEGEGEGDESDEDADADAAGEEGNGEGEGQRAAPVAGAPAARRPVPVPPAADQTDAQRLATTAANEAIAAERVRSQEIAAIGARAGLDAETIRNAQANGTSVAAFRDAAYEALIARQEATGTFPHGAVRGGQDEVDTRRAAVTNALLHRFGIEATLTDAARAGGWRDMSALDIAKELMRERGEKVRGSVNEIAERAFHTTSDFPIVMGQVTQRTILAGYAGYENTFQLFANRNVVSDFREVKFGEFGDTPDLLKVNEHGEFKRGTMRESEEGFKIETYGRIIGFTRKMLINDQTNIFIQSATNQGRKVAKLEGDVVWGAIIRNAKLKDGKGIFHADHGNLAASASALSIDSLKAARTAFRKMKDIDGEPIALPPKFLFVGSELEIPAQVLITGVTTPQTTAQVIPEAIRSLTPVYEYRLDAVSDTVWFLFADPANTNGRGMQYAYLAGQEQPFYESRVGFDVDGIEYKVRHDFGAGPTDYRFGYMNAGA